MIEIHIFDLYGTLVDIRTDESMPALWKRMALLFSLQGADYSPQELFRAYAAAVHRQIELRAKQMPHVEKAYIEPDILSALEDLYAQKGVRAHRDQVKDTALIFRTLSLKHIRLYPGALETLRELRTRGQGIYLLSNAQAAFTRPELQKLQLAPLFDGIVLSSDVGIQKPHKAIFEHLMCRYGLRPDTCIMVGNDGKADMLGASSVGMAGRYIHTDQSPPRQGPLPANCREIRSLRELL